MSDIIKLQQTCLLPTAPDEAVDDYDENIAPRSRVKDRYPSGDVNDGSRDSDDDERHSSRSKYRQQRPNSNNREDEIADSSNRWRRPVSSYDPFNPPAADADVDDRDGIHQYFYNFSIFFLSFS
jgi:hypothetical protein